MVILKGALPTVSHASFKTNTNEIHVLDII